MFIPKSPLLKVLMMSLEAAVKASAWSIGRLVTLEILTSFFSLPGLIGPMCLLY